MDIRRGTINDAESIAALIADFHTEIADSSDGFGATAYFESVSCEAETSYLASDRFCFLIAERDGEMLGFIALRDSSHILHLFVRREHQRQGVARRLWESAKSVVPAPQCFTVNSSLRAVAVYSAFGFKPSGDVESRHGVSVVPMRLDVVKQAD
jgi:GNAT superfamily N-acetyltransferase